MRPGLDTGDAAVLVDNHAMAYPSSIGFPVASLASWQSRGR
jgi:hypothetical protein